MTVLASHQLWRICAFGLAGRLEEYFRWIELLEMPVNLEDLIIPTACFGRYRTRLWIGSSWPIVLLLTAAAASVGWELATTRRKKALTKAKSQALSAPRSHCATVLVGLQRVLPLTLGLTFITVPSVSTRIFKTFLCDPFEYREGEQLRYLHDDLGESCDSDDYATTRNVAFVMLIIWPVFVPLLYAMLLAASRDALRAGVSTPLSRATSFLSGDYKPSIFWWEPLEMCRKLTLSICAVTRTAVVALASG